MEPTVSKENKKSIFQNVVKNTVLNGAEVLPMSTRVRDNIRVVQLDYIRTVLATDTKSMIRNEEVWRRMNRL